MKKILYILAIIIIVVVSVLTITKVNRMHHEKPKVNAIYSCALRTDMRKLWSDHAYWTREVINCIVDGSPGREDAIERLLNNQNEIGDAIKPYYGDIAAKELTRLLRLHIAQAATVVVAARDHNTPALKEAQKKWNQNSEDIARFFSKTTNIDYAEMKYMMDYHLKLTTIEATSRINKKYGQNIKDYDKVYYEVIEMSDMITEVIVKQFPGKFICEDKQVKIHY